MKSRDGANAGLSFCFVRPNCSAAAIALAVQLPSWPWSTAGGHLPRRSILAGNGPFVGIGAK